MPFPESIFARSGRFSEIYPVGRGAVGRVYSAVDNLGRRVAVKEALPTAEGFAAFRAKFEKESRLQAALDHPNIVRVHHLEEDPETGELYLVCEYADAGSLAELLEREGPLPPARAIALALDICAALGETERRRIVHRDIKPSNILLFSAPAGLTAKLGDFGIAQDARQRKTTVLPGASHPGTPLYLAPEQADVTAVVDTRADIFALGLTLWEMLTGEDYKALQRDGVGPALESFRPDAGPGLGQVIARAARPDREQRYQTPAELAADLRRLLGGQPPARETIRSARLPRSGRPAPLVASSGLGPVALTMALVLGSALFTFTLTGISRLLSAGATAGALAPTAPPPDSWALTATPIPAFLAPTAPPGLAEPTATPFPLPTPWLDGTAMAEPGGCRAGSGQLASEGRPANGVRAVRLEGVGILELRQGEAEALTVAGDDNLLQMIYSYVQGDELVIGIHGCVREAQGLSYTLTVRDLRALTIAGAADARLDGLSVERLALRISGVGTIEATGSAGSLDVQIDGRGAVLGRGLQSASATVAISGAGSATIWATESLDASISGTGDVEYLGSPRVTQTIAGIGGVRGVSP